MIGLRIGHPNGAKFCLQRIRLFQFECLLILSMSLCCTETFSQNATASPLGDDSFLTVDCAWRIVYVIQPNEVPFGKGKLHLLALSLEYDTVVIACYPCSILYCVYNQTMVGTIGPMPQATTVTVSTTDCEWGTYPVELQQVSDTLYQVWIHSPVRLRAGYVRLDRPYADLNAPCVTRKQEIDAAAARYGIPRDLFRALGQHESFVPGYDGWNQFDPRVRCQPVRGVKGPPYDWGMEQVNEQPNRFFPKNMEKVKWDFRYNLDRAANLLWLGYHESVVQYGAVFASTQHWDNALAAYNHRQLPYVPPGKKMFWYLHLGEENPEKYINKVREKERQAQWPC